MTFPKPPTVGGEFGTAIATLGNNRVVLGSLYGYCVCVFTTNGDLVTTIAGQSQPMGSAVVAFGNDKLLIGAHYANEDPDTWVTNGAAYLYSTNGTRLMTFNNPSPGSGAAYLFRTNGTRLMTITNPAPAADDWFGHRIAVLGNNRVVIGAPGDNTTRSAYVFSLNGAPLATINNPRPGRWRPFRPPGSGIRKRWRAHRRTAGQRRRVGVSVQHSIFANSPFARHPTNDDQYNRRVLAINRDRLRASAKHE